MSLFDKKPDPSSDPNADHNEPNDQAPNAVDQLLAGIKNDQGEQKYATAEDAIKASLAAQDFIDTLKSEKLALEAKIKSQDQLQELLNNRPNLEAAPAELTVPATPQLTAEDVMKVIEQRDANSVAKTNSDMVSNALAAEFGAEAQKVLRERVASSGLTEALADNMARTSPQALLKLLDVKPSTVKPSTQSLNTESFNTPKVEQPKFLQMMTGQDSPQLQKWRETVAATNARLGLTQ